MLMKWNEAGRMILGTVKSNALFVLQFDLIDRMSFVKIRGLIEFIFHHKE
jgi:hypothetical protein